MTQLLIDNIDQLDLALDQLSIHDRNFDRIAFMLVDNVVELTLLSYARDRDIENKLLRRSGEPKYDTKLIMKALSRSFDKKVKAVRDLGLIDDEQCTSLLHLHSFRNTAYHQGHRHETILHSLAIFYFMNACDLLMQYDPSSWSWSSEYLYSHRARKYISSINSIDPIIAFKTAFARLQEVVDSFDFDLIGSLFTDMESVIDHTDKMINVLQKGWPVKRTRNEVVVDAQVWSFAFTEKARKFARDNGYTEKGGKEYTEWLTENYNWKFKTDPIDTWRRRLTTLSQQTNNHKALKHYCDFMNQTNKIRSQIDDSVSMLEALLLQLIDETLGK